MYMLDGSCVDQSCMLNARHDASGSLWSELLYEFDKVGIGDCYDFGQVLVVG